MTSEASGKAQTARRGRAAKKEPQPKTGMGRLFELAGDRKGLLFLSGLLAVVAAVASFVPYIAIYFVMRDVILVYPEIAALDVSRVAGYGILALIGIVVDVVCYFLSSVCSHIAAFKTQYALKSAFSKHLARIPLGYHLSFGSGRFRKVIDADIGQMEQFLAHSFPDIVASFTAPVTMLVVLFAFDWRFGLAALAAVVVALVLQMMTFGAAGPQLMEKLQKTMADMTGASIEYVRGMPVLKAFGQTARSFKRLCESIGDYTKFMLEYTFKWENYTAAFNTVINNIYLFIIPVGILLGPGEADYASFVLNFMFYLLFVPSLASVLSKVMYVSSSSMRIAGGVGNFDAMMGLPELPEPETTVAPRGCDVVFDDVTFAYEQDDAPALTRVNFTAKAGQVTALVGPSGGGKSTIAHLIPRFWDIEGGAIRLGGADIRTLDEQTLMEQVSFVFQDTYLFGQSIKENIRMGRKGASDEEVERAARAAQCDEFVGRLANGYDTVFGEEGQHLSGGERQRVAIARALVKGAPLLVLDEATAFADPENEQLIQNALKELMKGKTVIMIAHRLSTVKDADSIVVMCEGSVMETGRHDELLEQKGIYARMWENYNRTIAWKIARSTEEVGHG